MKDSFILYNELIDTVSLMPDEDAGILFKMILNYENGRRLDEDCREESESAMVAFTFIQRQLDRCAEKYEQTLQARSRAGKKGMEKRWGTDNTDITNDNKPITNDNKDIAKITVPVPVPVNEPVNKDISPKGDIIEQARPPIESDIDEIIDYLNAATSSKFSKNTDATRKAIRARLKAGATVDDFHKVIDHKVEKWGNDERMREYLRPQTLFAPSHFESYLNEANRPRPSNVQSDYARNTGGMAKDNKFMDYDQRTDYDYEALERMLTAN